MQETSKTKKRTSLRFSLKSLLAVVFVSAIGCAAFAIFDFRAHAQKQVIIEIENGLGSVVYPQITSLPKWKQSLAKHLSLDHVTRVREIRVEDSKCLELAKILQPKSIHGSACHFEDLRPLGSIDSVKQILFSKCTINDLSELRNLKGIDQLDFYECNLPKDITCFTPQHKLREMDLSYPLTVTQTTIENISQLSSLEEFSFTVDDEATDLSSLSNLTHLETLTIYNVGSRDLSFLSSLSHLKILDLDGLDVDSTIPRQCLARLESLILHRTPTGFVRQLELKEVAHLEILVIDPLSEENIQFWNRWNSLKK